MGLWQAGTETHRRFAGRSTPRQTDIVLFTRNGYIGGYQEAITDINMLGTMMGIVPAGTLERLLGESSRQASLRWLSASNRELNTWMQQKVIDAGMSTRQAIRQFQERQRWKTAQTIIEALGKVLQGRVPGAGGMPNAPNQELADEIDRLFSTWDFLMDWFGRYDAAERAADPSAPRLE